jgi:hypothetical protein
MLKVRHTHSYKKFLESIWFECNRDVKVEDVKVETRNKFWWQNSTLFTHLFLQMVSIIYIYIYLFIYSSILFIYSVWDKFSFYSILSGTRGGLHKLHRHGFGLVLAFIRSRLQPWQIAITWEQLSTGSFLNLLGPYRLLCCELLSVELKLHSIDLLCGLSLNRCLSFCSAWQTNSRSLLLTDQRGSTTHRGYDCWLCIPEN